MDGVKYRGVKKDGKRFQARIRIKGKGQYLGMFDTAKEAARAYDRAAIQAGRPAPKLNFQDKIPRGYIKERSDDVKYQGVKQRGDNFKARIKIDGKDQGLGTFNTPKEAAQAYDRAAIQAGRPISKLNFLNQVPKNYKPKKKKLDPRNTTGFRGVYESDGDRFMARISIGGKEQYIGCFATAEEAAGAYDLAAIQAKRPTYDLNFPDMMEAAALKVREEANAKKAQRQAKKAKTTTKKNKFPIKKNKKLRKSSTTKSNGGSSSSSSSSSSSTSGVHVSREFPIIRQGNF